MSETTTETDTEASTEAEVENDPKNSNHIAGCGIFLVILAMVVFLVSVSVYSYFDYKNAVISITEEDAKTTQVADISDAGTTSSLEKKFRDFSSLVIDQKFATLELSIDEINLAITHFEKLKAFSGHLYVTELIPSNELKQGRIVTRASLKMQPGFDDPRYMNGFIKFRPEIAAGSIFPIIEEAKPDTGNPVPPKMMQALSTLMFTEYRNDESIQNVFHKLTKVELIDGKLHITSNPASTATPIIEMDVEEQTNVGFQLFALLTFIFVTTIAFALWFSSYRKKQRAAE